MFWNKYPYTNFHELNLDWIIQMIKDMEKSLSEFEVLNKITFSGAWDITKQYPAWTIVNANNGTEGYISIKPVPAGVTIDNTDYWAYVANYTAVLADLQSRVIALESEMVSVVGAIKNDTILYGDNVKDKHFLFMGDSYLRGTICTALPDTYTRNYYDGWAYKTIQNLGLDSDHSESITTGGASFALTGAEHWQDTVSTYNPTQDPDDINYIILCGGANDRAASEADIVTGITQFKTNAIAKYPNAVICIGFIGYCRESSNVQGLYTAFHAYKTGCAINNIVFLGGLENVAQDSTVMGIDDLHPTETGYTTIAREITNMLKGGVCDYANEHTLTFTSQIGGTVSAFIAHDYMHNDKKTLSITNLTITGITGLDITAAPNVVTVLGDIDSNIIGGPGTGPTATCRGFINHSGGTDALDFEVSLINKQLAITLIERYNNDWKQFTGITAIAIRNVMIESDGFEYYN